MVEAYDANLEVSTRALFSRVLPEETGDGLGNQLMHTDMFNTYRAMQQNQVGTLRHHRFLPPELAPYLDSISIEALSPEELRANFKRRTEARQEFTKMAAKDPARFVKVIRGLSQYLTNHLFDPQSEVYHTDLPDEEKDQADVTYRAAYFAMPELWRDVSLRLVGKGNYLLTFKPYGEPISRRIREPPDNPVAFKEALVKWHTLAAHAVNFFELATLDRLVMETDSWSDLSVVAGYPHVADADEHSDLLLREGYADRKRFDPRPHMFPLREAKQTRYRSGESIATVTVIDRSSPKQGFEYSVRHVDGTIAFGKISFPFGTESFQRVGDEIRYIGMLHSNLVQFIHENVGEYLPLSPFLGLHNLVAAFGRDMMVKKALERDYREQRGPYKLHLQHDGQPTVILLPSFQVTYNTDPAKANLEYQRLEKLVRELTGYWVTPHTRRLLPSHHPSPKQLTLAAAQSWPVPEGSTFVRGHYVGEPNDTMVQQYKSRSAAAVLFSSKYSPN
ncbi:MAG: hypothetical protein HY361_03435 [Candidatus Aenigmarchaeota archaeon]|nr:hypothetical protein [Candidatus Aenigmarchaeota archaeon]